MLIEMETSFSTKAKVFIPQKAKKGAKPPPTYLLLAANDTPTTDLPPNAPHISFPILNLERDGALRISESFSATRAPRILPLLLWGDTLIQQQPQKMRQATSRQKKWAWNEKKTLTLPRFAEEWDLRKRERKNNLISFHAASHHHPRILTRSLFGFSLSSPLLLFLLLLLQIFSPISSL